MAKCMSKGGKAGDIGAKKTTTKAVPVKGKVMLAAGGAAKARKGMPMTKAMPKKKQSQTVSLKLQSTQPCSHNRAESGMTEARHYRGTRGLITDRNRATLDP